ncbi:TolC family protein [Roseateles sp. LYH14W]
MPLSLHAQGAASSSAAVTSPMTLRQAFERAWAQQPEGAAAFARRDAAAARKAAAQRWTADAPSLEASARTDRLTRSSGAREYEAGVALPLWLPGERSRSRAVADAELATVDSRVAAAQWRVAGQVREAWWTLQLARLDASLAEARRASAAALAADVGRRAAAGDLSRADQHQADAALASAQAELSLAQAAVAQAQAALQGWGALPAAGDAVPGERSPDVPVNAETAVTHPALAELSDRVRLAQQQRGLAAVQRRANPELTLLTTRERGGAGERYGQTVTFGLRLPLGQSSESGIRAATAQADLIEAEQLLVMEQQRIAADIAAQSARLTAARAAQEATARRASLTRDTRAFYDKSFRLGETDLPTRLRVELDAFEAERQNARARIAVDQAISSLRQALGLLPE